MARGPEGEWAGTCSSEFGRVVVNFLAVEWAGSLLLVLVVIAGFGQVDLVVEFPDEGAEFPGDGDNGLLFALAAGLESDVALVEAVLHSPGELFDLPLLALLSFAQGAGDLGSLAVVQGTLHEHPSGV